MSETKPTRGYRLYKIWADMKTRCTNPNCKAYKNYGERGITFCDEWTTFQPFEEWAFANGYNDNLTLDRIDTNGNYEPSNCRWSSYKEQGNNTRRTRNITYNGKIQSLQMWCEELNMNRSTLRNRLNNNWSIEDALTKPVEERKRNNVNQTTKVA